MRGRFRGNSIVIVTCVIAAVACTPGWELPDRSDVGVQREEKRIATMLETTGAVLTEPGGDCEVRLLGRNGATSYVWAACDRALPGSSREGASVPARIRQGAVDLPEDGEGYGDSVEELFPPGLAALILNDQERLRP
jgi:hypothetical protein